MRTCYDCKKEATITVTVEMYTIHCGGEEQYTTYEPQYLCLPCVITNADYINDLRRGN
jgi:hypothetical protein